MRVSRSWPGLLGAVTLTCLPAPAAAQPVGSEFQVNTYTTSRQYVASDHAVAADASGNFVVVWDGEGLGDSHYGGVFGQRFDSEGAARGGEFRVNTYTTSFQGVASVASSASGNFVVVWQSFGQDSWYSGIFGQRYDSAGNTLGGEFRVSTRFYWDQVDPSVASDAAGNFVVVWSSYRQDFSYDYGIFAQRYDSEGVRRGGEFLVNTYIKEDQWAPSVASDASGNFVVVWASEEQDAGTSGVFGQRYDSDGVALGGEFRVNSYTPGGQVSPSVAADAAGNFVVLWNSIGQDGSADGIFGQRYDSEGVPRGVEFQVNTFTTASQSIPSVSATGIDQFVVAWESLGQDGNGRGIFGRRYVGGVAQGPEFLVDSYTTGAQRRASAGGKGTDEFVVVWNSGGRDQGPDGSGTGVFGQRYDFSGQMITVVKPNTNVRWLIGSVKEVAWTHNLGLNSTFRISWTATTTAPSRS